MGRRTLLLVAALVVAVLGTVLVFLYAQRADERATADQSPAQVLVAKTAIAAGTSGATATTNGAFELTTVPSVSVVPGALSSAEGIADKVALVPIYPGQQIISQQWGTSGSSSGLVIPPGKIALMVQLGDPQRLAGFLSPGSEVVIFTAGTPKTGAGAGQATVQTLLAGVQVLAVGPTTTQQAAAANGNQQAEQIPTALVTLALTQVEAQKVLYASGQGGATDYNLLYFGLMTKDSKVVPAPPGVNGANVLVGR